MAEQPIKNKGELVDHPDIRQVDAAVARRRHGQLRNHSLLSHEQHFSASDLHTGSQFALDVDRLLKAVRNWQECSDTFENTLHETSLSTHITDGSGPVANALGNRFNHRLGTDGGVGYAADAYLAGLQQILVNLIESAQGYTQSDHATAADVTRADGDA
jgi:hypothetical protein